MEAMDENWGAVSENGRNDAPAIFAHRLRVVDASSAGPIPLKTSALDVT